MAGENAPGWDAIQATIEDRLGVSEEPLHWSTGVLPGHDGVYGISAYRVSGAWFFVTFGLTELYEKESDDAVVSGWGFELTMRTPRADGDAQPPKWPLALLARLGEYVFTSGSPFRPGHRLDPGGPITGATDTRLTAVAFTAGPELPSITTPNGSVDFLQVVGISSAELEEMQQSTTAAVLEELAHHNPNLVTDPNRRGWSPHGHCAGGPARGAVTLVRRTGLWELVTPRLVLMALQFEPEVGHARWFVDGDSDWQRLCSIGPSGFARYVRVLHPDDGDDDGVGDERPDGGSHWPGCWGCWGGTRALHRTASSDCGTAMDTSMAGRQLPCRTRRGARAGGIGGGRPRS